METTFFNVIITVSAKTPQDAYTKLCELLNDPDVEYTTDTFKTYVDGQTSEKISTEKLWPDDWGINTMNATQNDYVIKLARLEAAVRVLMFAHDTMPGDDLGANAIALANIEIRKCLKDLDTDPPFDPKAGLADLVAQDKSRHGD